MGSFRNTTLLVSALIVLLQHFCCLQAQQQQQQQQLEFLGQQPFRVYASRLSPVGLVLYQFFAVEVGNSSSSSTGDRRITYSIVQDLTDPALQRQFLLRPDSGELELAVLLHAPQTEYRAVIEASTSGSGGSQTTAAVARASVVVTVVPGSDRTPRFEQESYNLSVYGDHPLNEAFSVVRGFSLSFPQSPETYSIVSDTSETNFAINSSNGLLLLVRGPLDRERLDLYTITVRLSFNGGFLDTRVLVNVLDRSDNPPRFAQMLYNMTIPENLPVSSSVLTVSAARDADAMTSRSRMLQYSLTSLTNLFNLDSTTGVLTTAATLDHEREAQYHFTVTASDAGSPSASSSTVLITVNIANINDECPRFENPSYAAETQATSSLTNNPILTVRAIDPDQLGDISYSIIEPSSSSSSFTIDSSTGVVRQIHLGEGVFSLNVSASDGSCVTFVPVEIGIGTANNHSPEFSSPCEATLMENPERGTEVVTLVAMDRDVGVNGIVSYTLHNTSLFSIDEGGVVRTTQAPGQYDSESSSSQVTYHVGVTARDSSGVRQDFCLLTITLLDQNDNHPIFTQAAYSVTVSSAMPSGDFIARTTAFDVDQGSNGDVMYSLSFPANSNFPFAVNESSGEIIATGSLRESSFLFSVVAADMGTPRLSSSATVNVTLLENSPVFEQSYYSTTLCENVQALTSVLTVTASNNPSSYQIIPGTEYDTNRDGALTILNPLGLLQIGSSVLVDFEKMGPRKSFLFDIQAQTPAGGTSFTTVEIFIEDLNDNFPTLASNRSFTFAENQPVGTIATQLVGLDADSGRNGEIAFRLATSSTTTFFDVSSNGTITSNHVFDFENTTETLSGELIVELSNPNATDRSDTCPTSPSLGTATIPVRIQWNILDLNDHPPAFTQSHYIVQVPEDEPVGSRIFNLTVNDQDASDRGRLSFSLTDDGGRGAEGGGTFALESGGIVVARSLDFERGPTHSLTLQVTDGIFFASSAANCPLCSASLFINVTDVDDELPVFQRPSYEGTVEENARLHTSVLAVSAQDPDSPSVTYSLSESALGRFAVSDSGTISVSGILDRDDSAVSGANDEVRFLVFAEAGSAVAVANVTIMLLDVNDHAPRFLDIFTGSVVENMAPTDEAGIHVTQVEAVDLDQGRNGTVTYSLINGMEHGFRIDPDSGIITAHVQFDREAQSEYFLTVQATDNGTIVQRTSITRVRVEITDVNDNPTSLPFPYMFARIFENPAMGFHVFDIPILDLDSGENPNLTYTLRSASLPGKFQLNVNTGEVTVSGSLDYEIPLHREITLSVEISEDSSVSVGNLSISLLDLNDNVPMIENVTYSSFLGPSRTILENLAPGPILAIIRAFDEDGGLNGQLDYTIVSGDERGDFNISSDGMVRNTRLLDFETTSDYSLVVEVSDRGSEPVRRSSTTRLTFRVRDINDNAPTFSQAAYSVSVVEDSAPMASILQVSATDPDQSFGGVIQSYEIVSGNIGDRFTLNSTSGVLGTIAMFDREDIDSYTLVITANDAGADSQTGTGMILVSILDRNDNPSTSGGLLQVLIYSRDGLLRPTTVGPVHFSDPDTDDTFQNCLVVNQDSVDVFEITNDCNVVLAAENPEERGYTWSVRGSDGLHTTVTAEVRILVEYIASINFPDENVVTVTVNTSAEEYFRNGLNVSIPNLLATHLRVSRSNLYIVSVQQGYHTPTQSVDITLSARDTASGELLSQTVIIDRLFQARDRLFIGSYRVTAIPTDPCVTEPCFNQASCNTRRVIGETQQTLSSRQHILFAPLVSISFECECVPGTSGELCDISFNDCYSNPCMHGAQCTDAVQGFVCDCPEGTSGQDCRFNPDECSNGGPPPCQNGAQCINGFNTYECECLPGYYGPECQYSYFLPSSTCDPDPCQNGAICSPGRDGFSCLCPRGFNGTLCENVIQLQGGCVGNPCHNGSLCVDTTEGPRCLCSVGFTGPFCRWPLDNCELNPCRNGGTCEPGLYGSYLCTCAAGFTGENCTERISGCVSSPCLNGGRCVDDGGGTFTCQCMREFTGALCDVLIIPPNLCEESIQPLSCSEFSNCTSGRSDVTCTCHPGYHGIDCSMMMTGSDPLSPCARNPCLHGGSCIASAAAGEEEADHTCQCSEGFTGQNCGTNIDDCTSAPCLNGGTCQDGLGGFVCNCTEGTTGALCEIFCPPGHRGEFCEISVSFCLMTSCENGGTCVELVDRFSCECPSTHTGSRCELLNNCSVVQCLNGGTCVTFSTNTSNTEGGGGSGGGEVGVACVCPPGFEGRQCQLLTASFSGGQTLSSHRTFEALDLQGRGEIALEFATRARDGLLLYSTQFQAGRSVDFVSVEVVGGNLRVSFSHGSGQESAEVVSNAVQVSDGFWHQVTVQMNGKSFSVLLDDCLLLEERLLGLADCKSSALTPGPNSFLNLGLPLWIGGVPFQAPPTPGSSSIGFSGCIRNVTINGRLLDMASFIEERNSESGCGQLDEACGGDSSDGDDQGDEQCGPGVCVPLIEGSRCICPPQVAGDSCERDTESLMFDGRGGYVEYQLHAAEDTIPGRTKRQAPSSPPPPLRSSLIDELSFRFRTELRQGILFYIGQVDRSTSSDDNEEEDVRDFMFLQLQDEDTISFHINLGSREEMVNFPDTAVSDSRWHLVTVQRSVLDLQLGLDNLTITHTLGGDQLYLDVGYSEFYAGGVPATISEQNDTTTSFFTGCLEDIRLDQNILPTSGTNSFAMATYRGAESSSSSSVTLGCALRGCFPDPCQGGECAERGETEFVCTCSDGSVLQSMPCSEPVTVTPYLLVAIACAVLGGLVLFLIIAIIGMVIWKRHSNRKFDLMHSQSLAPTPSEILLSTRDCVIISNEEGGGEQDTTMTDERWQRSCPLPRKDDGGSSGGQRDQHSDSASSSGGGGSIVKMPIKDEIDSAVVIENSNTSRLSPSNRARSPVISAFIDERLKALREEYRDLDSLRNFDDGRRREEEGNISDDGVSLSSTCSYASRDVPYTLEQLRQAGPEFQKFEGLLEVLEAEHEGLLEEDLESRLVHTGQTQTQTDTGTQSQQGGYYF